MTQSNRLLFRTLCASVCVFSASVATAHDVWLVPSSTVLSRAGYVTVDGAVSNDTFHFTYRPLMIRDNLFITAPDGAVVEPENLVQGRLRTVFDAHLEQPGSYRISVVNAGVMASWQEGGETRRWRGRVDDLDANVPADAAELQVRESASRVETFVTVGTPGPILAAGEGLELVPVSHPNDLYDGERSTFQFVMDGVPVAGLEVSVMAGGTRYRDQLEKVTLVTDDQGRVSYTWPAPGLYWLDTSLRDENTRVRGAIQRRLAYSATFEVLPQ